MLSIGFAIGHIVDEIYDTGERAENHKALNGRENRSRVEKPPPEDEPGEQQKVLRPLMGPERDEQVVGSRTARCFGERRIRDRQIGRSAARHLAQMEWLLQTLADAEKLRTASSSESKVSNTVKSFVMASKSVIFFVRLSSFRLPPCRLTVV